MLVLSRKTGESIIIDGQITVHILKSDKETVKIGVDAPKDIPIFRKEIHDEIRFSNQKAATAPDTDLTKLKTPVMAK
ncbi:MAG: carbon storage regulator CsrA [Verrucomicrobiota bacterium]|jgi:carbon storage regulator|nr:carbon storage regulator CsrA [Verrucomicrobiota bacterium]